MKDKLLNLLLLFLLILLTINLFNPKKEENKLSNTIVLETQNSYTVPASIKIDVLNQTSS
jgi:hypothetical protein